MTEDERFETVREALAQSHIGFGPSRKRALSALEALTSLQAENKKLWQRVSRAEGWLDTEKQERQGSPLERLDRELAKRYEYEEGIELLLSEARELLRTTLTALDSWRDDLMLDAAEAIRTALSGEGETMSEGRAMNDLRLAVRRAVEAWNEPDQRAFVEAVRAAVRRVFEAKR